MAAKHAMTKFGWDRDVEPFQTVYLPKCVRTELMKKNNKKEEKRALTVGFTGDQLPVMHCLTRSRIGHSAAAANHNLP